jgi:hypothetical protein
MKLVIELATEVIQLINTATYNNSIDVVMGYIALTVISDIDEVYYNSISSPLKDQLEEANFELPIQNFKDECFFNELGIFSKLLLSAYSMISFLYEVFYFHWFPMLIYIFVMQIYGVGNHTV